MQTETGSRIMYDMPVQPKIVDMFIFYLKMLQWFSEDPQ